MTVVSHNTEAVSSRTKPIHGGGSFNESVLSCPRCGEGMEPMLLAMNDDGTQKVWWTCSAVKTKKCTFPLDMPDNIYWITRSVKDIERNEVPPPNLADLPIRYQHLYPSIFRRGSTKRSCNGSRQGSHESTQSMSSTDSVGSGLSAYDNEDAIKNRAAIKLDAMRRPRIIITNRKSFIPAINGERARAFANSLASPKDGASTSISTAIKFGRGENRPREVTVALAKKQVMRLMNDISSHNYGTGSATSRQWVDIKKIVVAHVKKRRAERAEEEEARRTAVRHVEAGSIDDLVARKLQKNKREYEERRQAQARAARAAAVKRAKLYARMPSMPGYGEEEDDDEVDGSRMQQLQHSAYAVTPPHFSQAATSPGPSTSAHSNSHHFADGFDFGEDFSSSALDHSGEVPSYGEMGGVGGEEEEAGGGEQPEAGSPFADLGPFLDGDLDGIEMNPDFEQAFVDFEQAFEFEEDFADLSQYN